MELVRNLRVDSVSRLEPTPPHRVDLQQTIGAAVELMRRERVGCLLVCKNGKLVGVFTERDLICRVLAVRKSLATPIAEVMTTPPMTINPKDSIRTVIRKMQQGGHRHLPVVDEDDRPLGTVSVKRIIHYLVEHYPSAVYNLPPEHAVISHEREGA